jgi:hypothetical protein
LALKRSFIAAVIGAIAGAASYRAVDVARAAAAPLAIDSIASPARPGSGEPNLAVASSGVVYMSWLEPAGDSGYALRVASLTGKRWSTPHTVRAGRDFFVNWADFPSLQVLDDGRLVAHWLQRTSAARYAYGVRISQSRNGGRSWTSPVTPHRDSSHTEHGFVAMWRERGQVGAVWLDGRKFNKEGHNPSNEMMLVSTTLDARGMLGAEVRLDERTCDCCQNSAAMTTDGPIVAYRDRSPDEIRDIHVTRRIGGKWTVGMPVHSDNWKIAACPVNGPAVAAIGNRVAVAWFTAANDSPRVKLAFSDDAGATFAAPLRLDGGNPAGRVDVALLSDRSALVTWIERTGGEAAVVRARRVERNGRLGAPMTIAASSAARASGFPRLAVAGGGSHIVFAWTAPGTPSTIRVARATAADFR